MIKLFELFAGYGGCSFALKKAGIPFECVGYSEIDKYAIQCYEQNHEGRNFDDITRINAQDLPDFNLLTGGFPCQSFSMAGKGMGELDTRGTLFNDIIRIAEVKQPRYILLENVKGLTTKKHEGTFIKIISELNRIGYKVKAKVLNSKDYGIPQNRDRVWFACFRNEEDFNKFEFPIKEELTITVRNLLDENVDHKYNLSERAINGKVASNYRDRKPFNVHGSCPTLKVGGDPKNFISPTLTTELSHGYGNLFNPERLHTLIGHWRRLTPNECFKLMGFNDNGIKLEGISDTQRYKLAGNGWCLSVSSKILTKLLED